jgi:hypothetical protein
VCFAVARGYQKAPPQGVLTIEDVAEHWDTVIDESQLVVVQTSRDEIALYSGDASWEGGGYR